MNALEEISLGWYRFGDDHVQAVYNPGKKEIGLYRNGSDYEMVAGIIPSIQDALQSLKTSAWHALNTWFAQQGHGVNIERIDGGEIIMFHYPDGKYSACVFTTTVAECFNAKDRDPKNALQQLWTIFPQTRYCPISKEDVTWQKTGT